MQFEATSGAARSFPTTRNSLVLQAGRPGGQRAWSELYRVYWQPVLAFLRSKGAREDEASDLAQGFFEALHRRNDLSKAPKQGRFRCWLRRCAKNYLYNARDCANSQKAGGGQIAIQVDEGTAEGLGALELAESRTPERLCNQRWALTLIAQTLSRLRAHYADLGQLELYESLEGALTGEGSSLSDAALAALLDKSQGAVRVDRCAMKKDMTARFRRYLRAEIAPTVPNEEAIDDKILELLAACA